MKIMLFLLIASVLSFSQSNNKYQIEVRNVVQTDSKTYEFDVYINSPENINLSAYQCAFTFNEKILGSSNIFEYITGTTHLINKPVISKILSENNRYVLAFASGPSFDTIVGEKRIGKFRFTSNSNFVKNTKIQLTWYSTKEISTIFVDGNFNEITNNFKYKISK